MRCTRVKAHVEVYVEPIDISALERSGATPERSGDFSL
uniref:Uncharacterized protein n=1 Tax=Myoviridae sp. ctlRg1 TaxID=2826692 RepID=A0A8S5M6H7_9CAUD|nr:MAG TPA: hypothetical protein [Myoviridae sp. ctlRg1]